MPRRAAKSEKTHVLTTASTGAAAVGMRGVVGRMSTAASDGCSVFAEAAGVGVGAGVFDVLIALGPAAEGAALAGQE
jgi:hypothetical protein